MVQTIRICKAFDQHFKKRFVEMREGRVSPMMIRSLKRLKIALIFIGAMLIGWNTASAEASVSRERAESLAGNYLAALVAGLSQDTGNAAFYYSEALKADPRSPELIDRSFVSLLADGQVNEAMRLADAINKRNSGSGIAQLALGIKAIKEKNYAQARIFLKKSNKSPNPDLTSSLLIAWSWLGSNNTKRALESIDALGNDPTANAFRDLHGGLIAKVAGRPEEAEGRLRTAYDTNPLSLRNADFFARVLAKVGKKDEALIIYRDLQKAMPRQPVVADAIRRLEANEPLQDEIETVADGAAEVLYGLGTFGSREGDELASLIYLRLATWLHPTHAPAILMLGDTYERMKQYESAIGAYQAMPESSPLNEAAELQAALNLEEIDRGDEAIAMLKKAIAGNPKSIDPLMALGNLYRSRKDFKNASDAYDKAIALIDQAQPGHWNLYYSSGIALERLKRWSEAEVRFKRALELSPDQPFVLNYLGYSWVDQNINLDEAFKMLQKAVDQRPNDGFIVDSLGWAYYRRGEYDLAAKYLEKAVELRPADSTINDHLGDVYWRLGRKLEAKFQWNHARDLGPEPEDLPKILEKIEKGLPDEPQKSGG